MAKRTYRAALNRGSCVYLGGDRVRFLWPCGCKRVETIKAGRGPRAVPIGPAGTQRLAAYWRRTGVELRQCKKHPDWYSRLSQVGRLNAENPQVEV